MDSETKRHVRIHRNGPILLVHIEVRFDLVEHGGFHLEQPSLRRTLVRTNDMDDEPFLILALGDRGMPLLDLLTSGGPIRLAILQTAQ